MDKGGVRGYRQVRDKKGYFKGLKKLVVVVVGGGLKSNIVSVQSLFEA